MRSLIAAALIFGSFGVYAQPIDKPEAQECWPKEAGGIGTLLPVFGNAEGDAYVWSCKIGETTQKHFVVDFADSRSEKLRPSLPPAKFKQLLVIKGVETGYRNWNHPKPSTLHPIIRAKMK